MPGVPGRGQQTRGERGQTGEGAGKGDPGHVAVFGGEIMVVPFLEAFKTTLDGALSHLV